MSDIYIYTKEYIYNIYKKEGKKLKTYTPLKKKKKKCRTSIYLGNAR